jgi:hypothetical protein
VVRAGTSRGGRTIGHIVTLVVALLGSVALALGGADAGQAAPRCFGAAARDPVRQPCDNPRLRLTVVPRPTHAQGDRRVACTRVSRGPAVCAFGPRSSGARPFALVGDSHSAHWRAALSVVARAKRWSGLSLYRTQCPFTFSTPAAREPAGPRCSRWRRRVVRWFRRHREVRTVFVSQHSGGSVVVPPGGERRETKVAGYMRAWRALPASVRRVIVIRDVPYASVSTAACIERALARRRPPGTTCARSRAAALPDDPAVTAAARLNSRRYAVVDLTDLMCDAARCYPVVGGVLVHADIGHLTRTFSASLGPFLLRAINRLGP